MKTMSLGLAGLFVLTGCNMSSEADRLEQVVAGQLANQGTVEEVSFTPQDENLMTGHATLRDGAGEQRRLNCTARRSSGANFDWNCIQAVDESLLREMEGMIRDELSTRGEVVEVDLQRANDDNNMAGHAILRTPSGEEVRWPCRAVRDAPDETLFSWRCGEAADAWAAERAARLESGGK